MVRSGWSISSCRARLPTMISPFGESDTTLGTSLSPSSPLKTSGRVRFMHATRLLVVPRSIPTTLPILSNSIWNIGLGYKIRYVLPAVQEPSNGRERVAIAGCVPLAKGLLQFGINFAPHAFELSTRGFKLRNIGFLNGHVQL